MHLNKIEAIKAVREKYNMGLVEAKNLVETVLSHQIPQPSLVNELAQLNIKLRQAKETQGTMFSEITEMDNKLRALEDEYRCLTQSYDQHIQEANSLGRTIDKLQRVIEALTTAKDILDKCN